MLRLLKYLCVLIALVVISVTVYFALYHQKRFVVFAGFNPNGKIPAYVITYLKGLNEISDGVVYIADSPLDSKEYLKLKNLVIHTEHYRHEEYDFGSYKRGYNWLKTNGYLDDADELVFANDSCYAPLSGFKEMFAKMAKRKELDFWGDLQNEQLSRHLQSYFLVFRKKVLRSKRFNQFINSITHQEKAVHYITKYETKLTPLLSELGYKWDSYMPYKDLSYLPDTNKNLYPLALISKFNHQFIKRRLIKNKDGMKEDFNELLTYLKRHHSKTYRDIVDDNPNLLYIEQKADDKHNVGAVFAAFSADNKVADYVFSYLKALNAVAENIVYVTDNELSNDDKTKLKKYVKQVIAKKHGEYDFGSYKRGYNWLKEKGYLDNINKLILANDSTILVTKSLKPVVRAFDNSSADFMGITANIDGQYHLQSYFLMFKKKVFLDDNFAKYLNNVKPQKNGLMVAYTYEVPLTKYLEDLGYKSKALIDYDDIVGLELNDKNCYPLTMLSKYHMPMLKIRTFTNRLDVREPRHLVLEWLKKNAPFAYEELIKHLKNIHSPFI